MNDDPVDAVAFGRMRIRLDQREQRVVAPLAQIALRIAEQDRCAPVRPSITGGARPPRLFRYACHATIEPQL